MRRHFLKKREVLAVNRFKCQRDPKCLERAGGEAQGGSGTAGATLTPSNFSPPYLVPSVKGDLFHVGNDA